MDDLRRLLRGGNLGLTFDVSCGKLNEITYWVDEFPKFNRLGGGNMLVVWYCRIRLFQDIIQTNAKAWREEGCLYSLLVNLWPQTCKATRLHFS